MLALDPPTAPCDEAQGLSFVCGAGHPEDLARIPGTRWVVASGFEAGSGIKLVDTERAKLRRWYMGDVSQLAPDSAMYPECPAPPDADAFNAQGMNLRSIGVAEHLLYVSNHGGREAIEVFRIRATSSETEPSLAWIGCVPMPEGMAANSVVSLDDGSILVTVLNRPGTQIADCPGHNRFRARPFSPRRSPRSPKKGHRLFGTKIGKRAVLPKLAAPQRRIPV